MKPKFLDTRLPNFKEEEAKLLAKNYVEKKYTQHTAKEIEEEFIRYILPSFVTSNMSPAQINALKPQLEEMVRSTLYEYRGNGVPVLQFKMYIPGPKLIKEMKAAEAARMVTNEEVEEAFAPENYGEYIEKAEKEAEKAKKESEKVGKKIEKAEETLSTLDLIIKNLSPNSKYSNIESAESKTKKIYETLLELMPKIIESGNAQLRTRANYALSVVQHMLGYLFAVKKEYTKKGDELANRLATTSFSNMPVKNNSNFIKELIELNNNNNEYNNNTNRNKITSMAMTKGKTSTDIKFIRDILRISINENMPVSLAIKLGVILLNLPDKEFKEIQKRSTPQEIYEELKNKMSGGRKVRHTRRHISKRRHTRRK